MTNESHANAFRDPGARAAHRRTRPTRRRGSVYAMVLGMTMLITVIGLGALATSRVTTRAAGAAADWQQAGAIAFSAAEHAVARLNADAASAPGAWRAAYTSGARAFNGNLGGNRMRWALVDEHDGLLDGDYGQRIKLYGVGLVGDTTRVYSVKLLPAGEPLAVLGTACHAGGNLVVNGAVSAVGGPLSTNGNLAGTAPPAERAATAVAGSGGTRADAKPMPGAAVFDLYTDDDADPKATPFLPGTGATGTFAPGTLSATHNDHGPTNPDGVYLLTIPDGVVTLTINPCHIKGTLLIDALPGRNPDVVLSGAMLLEPHRAGLPTLVTRGVRRLRIEGSLSGYNGGPSEIRGLVHCIGNETVDLRDYTYVRGTLITDGDIEINGVVGFTVDPALAEAPPPGYTTGNVLRPLPGSWKWDAAPAGS